MLGLKNKRKKKRSAIYARGRRLITVSESKSSIAEQFRTIRTNIKFSVPDTDLKTILVTSSTPGEGKSTNAANLAVVFAQEGKKVLLIDADMRKPTLHHTFGIFNTLGLSTLLSKQNDVHCAIQETPLVGLFVLPSGPIPPNPAELISSKSFDVLFDEMKKTYDVIIIDAPPLLAVSDAQVLSHKSDGTLLVVNSGHANRDDVRKAMVMLNCVHATILGVVLNNYKSSRSERKYYEYYKAEI